MLVYKFTGVFQVIGKIIFYKLKTDMKLSMELGINDVNPVRLRKIRAVGKDPGVDRVLEKKRE